MKASTAWKSIAPGILFIAIGVILATDLEWQWIFVVVAGLSLGNALVKRRWRWAPHPLLWGAGLGWTYAHRPGEGWSAFWMLCGISIILSFLVGLVPRRPPPPPPPRPPGAGVVIDVERVGDGPR